MATQSKTKQPAKAAPKAAPKSKSAPALPAQHTGREVLGIGLCGLGVMIAYFVMFDAGSGLGKQISALVRGLAGVFHYIIPGFAIWSGILLISSAKKQLPSLVSVLLVCALLVTISAGVHVFAYSDIAGRMQHATFRNFCLASYAHRGSGTGILGALLCWPLYYLMDLKMAGSIIVLLMLLIIELVLMRKISLSSIGERARQGAQHLKDAYQKHREDQATRAPEAPKPKRDAFAQLEDWGDGAEPMEPEPTKPEPRPSIIAPVREMYVPRVSQKDQTKPVPRPVSQIEPIETEDPEDIVPQIPGHLRKEKRTSKKSQLPPIHEPTPVLNRFLPEDPAEELGTIRSGSAHFGGASEDLAEEPLPVPSWEEPIPEPAEEMDEDDAPWVTPAPKPLRASSLPVAKPVVRAETPPAKSAHRSEPEIYNYPPIDLLAASKPAKLNNQEQLDQQKAEVLLRTLQSFGIAARLIGVAHGPTVTRFELSPAAGVKVSKITSLADDIALNLAAISVRIEAPIPGKAAVGVEVPNDQVEVVPLRDVLESGEARRHPSRLAVGLGRDNAGRYIVADLAKMPHVLIAGATGAGKSVCINCIICSILYRATPDEVRLIMIDPKVVELSVYNGIPHLLVPVVTDPKKAASALEWAVVEMGTRYKKFAELGVRDMKGYNQRRPEGEPPMPQIVIIIDELADLMMVSPGEVEDAICRLAQLARAAGIHLVIATQRPSVNVITGVIKANIPSRIAFAVSSQVDSRTILDSAGAEKLLGKGDMLYAPQGAGKPTRVQGCFVSDEEVARIVEYVKSSGQGAEYSEDVIEHLNQMEEAVQDPGEQEEVFDDLLADAVEIAVESGQASISMLQRRLRVGYARAGRLLDEMEKRKIISGFEGSKPRQVLLSRAEYERMFGRPPRGGQ